MHSAVLQNKKYIKFSEENTVEVLALGRLEEGVRKGDRRAAKYKAKDENGNEVEYMVSWPNLTFEEIQKLRSSKAGQYNKTGKIPYTALVDPHTEEEITHWSGGQSAKTIMEAAAEARKELEKKYGPGMSRKDLARAKEAQHTARSLAKNGEFAKALKALDKGTKGAAKWPEVIRQQVTETREAIIGAANAKLDEVANLDDAGAAKKQLKRLMGKLRGTGLEGRAREMLKALSAAGG